MISFDYIKIEAYLSVSHVWGWVDLTPDLIFNPRPTCSRGMSSPEPTSKTADPGQLKFVLDNSAQNSASTLGYYSPNHPNCISPNNELTGRGGWGPGTPVRVSFAYLEWQPYYKWYGYVDIGGIRVFSGTRGERRVEVTATDFMGRVANSKLNLMTVQGRRPPAAAMGMVVDNMPQSGPDLPQSPLAVDYDVLSDFLSVFDGMSANTTALSEMEKIAQSSNSYIFAVGDSTGGELLKLCSINTTGVPIPSTSSGMVLMETGGTDYLLLETGGSNYLLLDEVSVPHFRDADIMLGSEFVFGKDIINHVTLTTFPREWSSGKEHVLWTLQDSTPVEPGETVRIRGSYTDPTSGQRVNGTDFVDPPVVNVDYQAFQNADGTGADLTSSVALVSTFGSSDVELQITNNGGTTFYTGGTIAGGTALMRVRGRMIKQNDTVRIIATDEASMADYGLQPVTIEEKYARVPDSTHRTRAEAVITKWADPQYSVVQLQLLANRDQANMIAFLFGEPPMTCYITEAMTGLGTAAYNLMGYSFEMVDSHTVIWYPKFCR